MDDVSQIHYLREALEKIRKCKGAYAREPVTRCGNVIENTMKIIDEVFEKVKG